MIKCPKCGKELEETHEVCPECNCPIGLKEGNGKKKKIVIGVISSILIIGLFVVLIATHIICLSHEWEKATCDKPETCKYCGKTQGERLEHKWVEATCTRPKVCILCHKTEGDLLEHKWLEATCTQPKTCQECKETEGSALGHKPGDWEEVTNATLTQSGKMVKYCKMCHEEVDSKYETKTIGLMGEQFNFKPLEIIEYLNSLITNKDYEFDALSMHVEEDEDADRYMVGFYENGVYTDTALVINAKDLGDYCNAVGFIGGKSDMVVVLSVILAKAFSPYEDEDELLKQLSTQEVKEVYGKTKVIGLIFKDTAWMTFMPNVAK